MSEDKTYDNIIQFDEVHGRQYTVFVSESAKNYFNIAQHNHIKAAGGYDQLILKTSQFAVEKGKLKFTPTRYDDPVRTALEDRNFFSIQFPSGENLVVTAATFQEKKAVFMFMWEQIGPNTVAHDGQNKRKIKPYNKA